MAKPLRFAGLLLITSALTAPAAFAQAPDAPAPAADQAAPAAADPTEEPAPDVSLPGGDAIIVTGRRNANIEKNSSAVVSVLSAAAIARTGEGNIAGALGRVTGLSVVGNGFVYVRGLGDRYSLALLNGSPLPSPEPLKRVVPLDLFPTNIVSSSLVQKSYSPNFPGEFGGGVINLTTSAVPKDKFLTISVGGGFQSETTGINGYTYFGARSDWTGFDNGTRGTPAPLAALWADRKRLSEIDNAANTAIAASLIHWKFAVVQRDGTIPANATVTLSGGTSFDLGGATLGLIATAGYSSKWQTRDSLQQDSLTPDISDLEDNFQRVSTDHRVVVNGLLGLGLEFGDNKVRWTNLFIRDTLKHARLGIGQRHGTDVDIMQQRTAWYERQLIDTQFVGEFKLTPDLSVDLRGSYANSQREAPNEFSTEYVRTNSAADPYGNVFINRLNGNTGDARIAYSDLNEDLGSGGVDVSYKPIDGLTVSAGYAYLNTKRLSTRREYAFRASFVNAEEGVGLLRPDLLLAPNVINTFKITLNDNEPTPAFEAKLINHAGYGKLNWQVTPEISIDAGVRYEKATESVVPVEVYASGGTAAQSNTLKNNYWLPSGTLTWQFQPDMQLRFSASKTIARPQFREMIFQQYFDPDNNRLYFGNTFLKDSQLINAEARYEWYFARDQRLSLAGFYKKIDHPIESYITIFNGNFATSFANAPKADLYGGEFELQKFFDMSTWSDADFFSSRRLVAIANYTYTKSKLKVAAGDTTAVSGAGTATQLASDYFRDGASLTGQSDHLINLQLGFEDTGKLSQQTFILSYASKRVTSRGLANSGQPDVYEHPGFNLDFVWREGVSMFHHNFDLKFEARNITYNKYNESQTLGTHTVYYNRYNIGTTFNFSISTTF